MGLETEALRVKPTATAARDGAPTLTDPSAALRQASLDPRKDQAATIDPSREETATAADEVPKRDLASIQADLDRADQVKKALETQLTIANKLLKEQGLEAALPAYKAAIKDATEGQPTVLQEIKQVSAALQDESDPIKKRLLATELAELDKLKRAPGWTRANMGLAERNEGVRNHNPDHVAQGLYDLLQAAVLDPKMCDDPNFQAELNDAKVLENLKAVSLQRDVQPVARWVPPRDQGHFRLTWQEPLPNVQKISQICVNRQAEMPTLTL
jgi:hypothetical protein